ncbi:hypothetical protein [uncultured Tateyamaria sp.]|uniref:hypothetical protein n=1 Tax=uncultured Tateyamaria sp. TaxID=455651 RepID=UPI00261E5441|nr:hypothetical protein [uncultured Tateyamaria sp.]
MEIGRLTSSVIAGNTVLVRRGELDVTQLNAGDQVVNYRGGYSSIEKIEEYALRVLPCVCVTSKRLVNDHNAFYPSLQMLRCDREKFGQSNSGEAIFSPACTLVDGVTIYPTVLLEVVLFELILSQPTLCYVSQNLVELANPERHGAISSGVKNFAPPDLNIPGCRSYQSKIADARQKLQNALGM